MGIIDEAVPVLWILYYLVQILLLRKDSPAVIGLFANQEAIHNYYAKIIFVDLNYEVFTGILFLDQVLEACKIVFSMLMEGKGFIGYIDK